MVLDGDATQEQINDIERSGKQYPDIMQLLILPGSIAPEKWIWNILNENGKDYSENFGIDTGQLKSKMVHIQNLYGQGLKHRETVKDTLQHLAQDLSREPDYIARLCGRIEAKFKRGDMANFRNSLLEKIELWRARVN